MNRKSKPAAEQVAELRASIADLQAERIAIAAQPRSRAEVRSEMQAHAERLVDGGRATLATAAQRVAAGGGVDILRAAASGPSIDLGVLLAPLIADTLTQAIEDALEHVPVGLAPAARAARMVEIGEELDRLESAEESIIEAAEAEGVYLARRPGARPSIVLRVA